MVRYYHPDEFAELKRIALDLGFGHVESGRSCAARITPTSRRTRSPPRAADAVRGDAWRTVHRRSSRATRARACAATAPTIATVEKRAAFRDQTYWGRPVPASAIRDARLLVVGLAPGGARRQPHRTHVHRRRADRATS